VYLLDARCLPIDAPPPQDYQKFKNVVFDVTGKGSSHMEQAMGQLPMTMTIVWM
jgi:hypothetical protein